MCWVRNSEWNECINKMLLLCYGLLIIQDLVSVLVHDFPRIGIIF